MLRVSYQVPPVVTMAEQGSQHYLGEAEVSTYFHIF